MEPGLSSSTTEAVVVLTIYDGTRPSLWLAELDRETLIERFREPIVEDLDRAVFFEA